MGTLRVADDWACGRGGTDAKEPMGHGRWGLLPGRSPLRTRRRCPTRLCPSLAAISRLSASIRTPHLSLSEKGFLGRMGEAARVLYIAAEMGIEPSLKRKGSHTKHLHVPTRPGGAAGLKSVHSHRGSPHHPHPRVTSKDHPHLGAKKSAMF